jgi:hypothetical protein
MADLQTDVHPPADGELITGAAAFAMRATQMVSAARMELAVLSQELDRRIYGLEGFGDALRRFVLQHQRTVRDEYLVADGRVLLYRETPQDLEAKYYDKAPHMGRMQLKHFDLLWNEAQPAQELRKLGI